MVEGPAAAFREQPGWIIAERHKSACTATLSDAAKNKSSAFAWARDFKFAYHKAVTDIELDAYRICAP